MPQSLARLAVHLIFSTKNRTPMIRQDLRENLNGYFVGTLENLRSPSIQVNCVADHVHILCLLSKNLSLAGLVEEVKKGSSKWMKTHGPELDQFYWQNGYGGFSVSESNIDAVVKYIRDQEAHHKTVSFQDEYRAFLKRHQIEFDERYVWD